MDAEKSCGLVPWFEKRGKALVAFDCADGDVMLAGRDCWCWTSTELRE